MNRRSPSLGVLAAFSLIVLASSCKRQSEAPETLPETDATQGLTVRSAESFDLTAYQGKVVLINFWATWCGYCRKEIPHLVKLYDQYKGKGFELVGVSLDRGGEEKARNLVHAFAEKQGIPYPLFLDSRQQIVRRFDGVLGLPTTFLIDQEGKQYKKYTGFQREGIFERDIEALLK